jgi:stress-induced morphogen
LGWDAVLCCADVRAGGCGQAFEATIVAAVFEKKAALARHRLVNAVLRTEIAGIHAWTPRCYTPEEWVKKGGGV